MVRRPPQTRYAQSSGAKIAYQVSGTGPPDLMAVPGLVSHLDIDWQQTAYRRFVRALEHGGRVIRLDKRGTGLSDPVGELPTLEQRVQDLTAVMAAARSSRAVLFGMSDGGRAAVGFAAAHPGRTLGLILYGTSYQPRAAALRRYRSVVEHWGEGRLVDLVAPSVAGPQARLAAGAFERAAASPAMAAALIESLGLIDARDLMGSLEVPVLVLHRDGDLIPAADVRKMARQIPGARLTVLPGRDHLPWVCLRPRGQHSHQPCLLGDPPIRLAQAEHGPSAGAVLPHSTGAVTAVCRPFYRLWIQHLAPLTASRQAPLAGLGE